MKIIFTALMTCVLITSCESDNGGQILDPPPSGECPAGQARGCDGQCAESPMVNDECGICDGGNADMDDCGICGGDGSTCEGEDLWNVLYNVNENIGGFQFNVTGGSINSAVGGAAEGANFIISTSAQVIIGFSLSGEFIPAGNGILVGLDLTGDQSNFCISELVLSGVAGEKINATIENCNTIKF
jgi:hypothetical protein